MTSKSESTDAKNLGNFYKLKELILTLQPTYNPGNNRLSVASITAQHTQAESALGAFNSSRNSWSNVVDQRQLLFDGLPIFCTALTKSVKSADAPPKALENLASLVRKFKATRATKPKNPDPDESDQKTGVDPKPQISVSQRSFDSQTDNFLKIIDYISILQAEFYSPTEPEYTHAGLTSRHNQMKNANNAVASASIALSAARIVKDAELYATVTGIYDTQMSVKNYIGSIFPNKPQARLANAIKFSDKPKPKKKKKKSA